jgi:type IV secretion system protein VirD4
MLPARVYFGQIIAVATIMLAAIWDASHWAPASLGHWTALGSAWFTDFFCVYLPWCLFEWWYGYEAYAAHVFERAGVIAVGCGFAGAPSDKLFTTYGLARWARAKEIAAAGLFLAYPVNADTHYM